MVRFLVMFIVTFIGLTNSLPSNAKPLVEHSRLRALFHGKLELSPALDLKTELVPSGDWSGDTHAPAAELGMKWKLSKWVSLELMAGLYFKPNEPAVAIRPSFHFGSLWSWSDLEIQAPSLTGYWFTQAQIKLNSFLEIGIEGEGWGTFGNAKSWSHGGGPNILIHFGEAFELDLTVHIRHTPDTAEAKGGWGLDPFVRFHFFRSATNYEKKKQE